MKGKEESKAPLGELIQNFACGVHEAVLVLLPAESGLSWAGLLLIPNLIFPLAQDFRIPSHTHCCSG